MSYYAKMYQIQFRLGLRPRPRPDLAPSWINGSTSKGRGGDGKGRGGKGKGGNRKGRRSLREGRGHDPTPSRPLIHISGYALDLLVPVN